MNEPGSTETAAPLPEPEPLAQLAPPLPPGTRLADRYLLGEVLGAGGYGVVYRATDERSSAPVAVKALRVDRLTTSGRQRLEREASLVAGVEHPHLVRVLGGGESEGVAYLTMELVEGESLRARMSRGALAIDEAVRIAREILSGLSALHALGIVHRDVKPGNVLLDGEGRAKLADFGLVRRWDADATRATSSLAVVGTAEYLAPEQALGTDVDGRSDLYSLGVVLFEMLSGRPVHERRSTFATVLAHLNQAAPDVRELRAETPAWLAAVVGRLLERQPADRYASAAEALQDLEQGRMPRGVLRRRLLRRSVAAGLVVVLAFGLAVWWAWERSRARYDRIEVEEAGRVVALDRAGRVLWRREGINGKENFLPIRTTPEGGLRIAAILAVPPMAYGSEARHRLALLDPRTGVIAEEVTLPSAANLFGGHDDRYGVRMRVFDLDQDGVDELLVSYNHQTSWPSYTVLYEPRQRRSHPIFVAGGHHWPGGVVDLDGDGRVEVLFVGTANRQGWYAGVAAVPIRPWMDEVSSRTIGGSTASTPDEERLGEDALLWYALLPRGFPAMSLSPVVADPPRRELTFAYQDGRRLPLSFDGFVLGEPAGRATPAERRASRAAAYASLRTARRLLGGGHAAEAIESLQRATREAEAAVDRRLREWSERVAISALVARGDVVAAEALADRISGASDSAPEIAFDTARALHLYGASEAAARWYQRGLGPGSRYLAGRRSWEYLEGAALALGELGRWAELEAVVHRQLEAAPSETALANLLLEWSRAHRGLPVHLERITLAVEELVSDLSFVALAEVRLAGGESPGDLLAEVERYQPLADDGGFCREWARAAVLERLGRSAEASTAAERAVVEAEREVGASVVARSSLPILRELRRRLLGERRTARP